MRARGWGAVGLVLSALVGPALASADATPVISAHRSAVSGFAENSLAAFGTAAADGETDLEGDAFVTLDGVLVMSHDSPLSPARCEGPYLGVPLRQLTADQVGEMTCDGEPVPRLEQVIEAVRPYTGATLRIEIKHPVADTAEQRVADAATLARLLSSTGMTARSILQDSSWSATTQAVHAVAPTQRVSALASAITTDLVTRAAALGAYDFSYGAAGSTGFWNAYIAANGLRSAVWTVDDPVRARALRAEQVGTIITDVPTLLRAVLADATSGCTLTRFNRLTALRSGYVLGGGASLTATAPRTSPDGRVVETQVVKVTARAATGTATVRIAPRGTPLAATWEKSLAVSSTGTSTTVVVATGDAGGIRFRNASRSPVTLTATVLGGTVYTCL